MCLRVSVSVSVCVLAVCMYVCVYMRVRVSWGGGVCVAYCFMVF